MNVEMYEVIYKVVLTDGNLRVDSILYASSGFKMCMDYIEHYKREHPNGFYELRIQRFVNTYTKVIGNIDE